MVRVILTGTPGCGKTSILHALEARGYGVVPLNRRRCASGSRPSSRGSPGGGNLKAEYHMNSMEQK